MCLCVCVSPGVLSAHLPDCDGGVTAAVGVVDYCVERLIDPLPEQDGRSCSGRHSERHAVVGEERDKTLFNPLQEQNKAGRSSFHLDLKDFWRHVLTASVLQRTVIKRQY